MIPNDSIDFYPTPDDLADDMIRALRASNDGSGLSYLPEPSWSLPPERLHRPGHRGAAGIYREHRTGKITCGTVRQRPLTLIASSFPPTSAPCSKRTASGGT